MDWRIGCVWACGLLRLLFYASMLPLWEGFDEWAHFAVIRATARGEILPPRGTLIARDVQVSLQTAPLPWAQRQLPAPSLPHDAFWQLTEPERAARVTAFRSIPADWAADSGELPAYETQQPPLYYWLMAPVLAAMRGWNIADQVIGLRWLSALLTSFTIPLVYGIGFRVFKSQSLALAAAAIVSLMPGFAIDAARIGNDGLAVALYAALIWLGLKWMEERRSAVWIGLTLGLGLLAKAYFLAAIPAVVALLLLRRGRWYGIAVASIGGWWYVRNLVIHGSLTGLMESDMPASGIAMWRHALDISWPRAIDSALFTHLYTGGWSMLTVRSWMYHMFYAAIAVAAVGLWRRRRCWGIAWLAAVYLCFWAGALYDILLLYVTRGVATSMGYYLYAVVAAEVPLLLAGFRRWAAVVFASLFGLLDIYTVHAVEVPYYTGMIRHKAGNALAAVHASDYRALGFSGILERLTLFHGQLVSSTALAVLWIGYLGATVALLVWVLVSQRMLNSRNGEKAP